MSAVEQFRNLVEFYKIYKNQLTEEQSRKIRIMMVKLTTNRVKELSSFNGLKSII